MEVFRGSLALLVLSFVFPGVAPCVVEAGQVITNLGACSDFTALGKNWIAYSVRESFPGEDLNGDGDTEDVVVHIRNLSTSETVNLGITGYVHPLSDDWVAIYVLESQEGKGLNGDGDTEDQIVHAYDLAEREITNLKVAGWVMQVSESWLVIDVYERQQGEDLNGDGDFTDNVPHVLNLATKETTSSGLAGSAQHLFEDRLVILVSESEQGEDLNGDGDLTDNVLHVRNLSTKQNSNLGLEGLGRAAYGSPATDSWVAFTVSEEAQGMSDLNGDGDTEDRVLHVHDLSTATTTNLGLAGWVSHVSGDRLVILVSERQQGEDLNGDGDLEDPDVVHVHDLSTGATMNLRLAPFGVFVYFGMEVSGDWLVMDVSESEQGEDLNQDGKIDRALLVRNLSAGETTILGLAGYLEWMSGDRIAVDVSEKGQGEDLNGDGDTGDAVLHLHDFETGVTTNLELDGLVRADSGSPATDSWLAFTVSEEAQGMADLNGDGDATDTVVHAHNFAAGETTNLKLAVRVGGCGTGHFQPCNPLSVSGDWLMLEVSEELEGEDLNGDGDTEDYVLHVHNFSTGDTTNLGLAGWAKRVVGDWLVIDVWERAEREDLDGDGDATNGVLHLVDLSRLVELRPFFRRGDCNDDGTVDISDAVFSLGSLFPGDRDRDCDDACDSNDDGTVDISDAIATLGVLFLGNGVIPLPGMTECGVDPTDDQIDCDAFERCP